MNNTCRTRLMTREEVALAIDWAAQEGWNPGLHDAETFFAADPTGFFCAECEGEPVASLSVVKYGRDAAFLGLYIVRPQWRGRGFGWQLWQAGMASAAGRQVGLDGVVAQQANYRKSGFTLAWRNVRHQATELPPVPQDERLVCLDALPFALVHDYDRAFFPADRGPFLRGWMQQSDAVGFGFVEGGALRGYGLVRRCRIGHKIGPLFADGEAVAETLYAALAASAGAGEPVYLDLPEPNAQALALARRHGMRAVFETARMYTGTPPALPLERMYGVTTFELG